MSGAERGPMAIGVLGAGGVGGYFGAALARAGHDVRFMARGAHLEAMLGTGLQVLSPKGDFQVKDVRAAAEGRALGPVELAIVAVKSWQLEDAFEGLSLMMGRDAVILPLLNGVEAADLIAERFGAARVFKGLTRIISHIEAPGAIRHVGVEPHIAFAELDGRSSERTERCAEVLRAAGISVEVPEDIDAALWQKFLFVVSLGGVGAVARAPIGVLRSVPETRAMVEQCMREIEALARARGVRLAGDVVERSLRFLDTLPEAGAPSLQRDVAEGRRSELDAWTGAVVRLAREAGVPVPAHEGIYRSLIPLELRARGELEF